MDTIEIDIARRIRKCLTFTRAVPKTAEVYHELQIAGDDALELLDGIAKDYGVSFEGFQFSEYFADEQFAGLFYVASRLGFCDRRRKSLTLAHLIAVVERGAWFEPPSLGKET